MHELSIAESIFDTIATELNRHEGARATHAELEIGSLSGVEVESLKFALNILPRDERFRDLVFSINITTASALCKSCGIEFPAREFWDPCPHCNSHELDIIRGKEMKISSITVEEA